MLVLAGIALGILSRVDETSGLTLGVSEYATWLLAPFVAGFVTRRAEDGLILLTVANVSYYALMLATEGELQGRVGYWFLVGWICGLGCGALGLCANRFAMRLRQA